MARRLALGLLLSLIVALPAALSTQARAQSSSDRLSSLQAKIAAAQAQESQLSSEIGSIEGRIRTLEQQVGGVSARLTTLERDLALQQAKLDRITRLFRLQTDQLDFLKRQYAVSLGRLNRRLIELYESDDPTTLDVLLSTQSLSDFLDQIAYVRDLGSQDARITTQVNSAKVRMHAAREKTKTTRNQVATVTRTIAVRTAQVRSEKERLLVSEKGLAAAKGHKKQQLASIQQSKAEYLNEAAGIQASSSAVSAQIQAAGSSRYDSTPSSRGLIWPVNGPVVSPFGMRWGRLHAGIDIAVGYGTPIHAAASGTVIFAGWMGGYGNLVVVDHGGGAVSYTI
jgi:murein DD-endopeptidase MepM/ murein hydrolase activator NlpD